MALLISAVILTAGLWFHRRRDRRILSRNGQQIFTARGAWAYLIVVGASWAATITTGALQLATGQTQFETNNPVIVIPGLVVLGIAVLIDFRTAQAIDAFDDDLGGPVAQLGRFVRVAYGTSACAAVRVLRSQPYP